MSSAAGPLVTVGMSVYNVESFVNAAIESIYNQSYSNWELIIIDDASTDGTYDVVNEHANDRVRVIRNSRNMGCYWNRNRAMLLARGTFFTTVDGDDSWRPDKLFQQVDSIIDTAWCACLSAYRCGYTDSVKTAGHNTLLFKLSIVSEVGFYDSVRFEADSEYVDRLRRWGAIRCLAEPLVNYRYRSNSLTQSATSGQRPNTRGAEIRQQYRSNYRTWHESSACLYLPFWQAQRRFPAGDPTQLCTRETVTASLATLPERVASLKLAIKSILDWADQINVFVNGTYSNVPDFLVHDRILVHVNGQNIGDQAKFFRAETLQQGYHFVCDDDVEYSSRYAEIMIERVEYYQRSAVVGVHGSTLPPQFTDYYADRRIYSMRHEKTRDRHVHFLGTGAIAYHTESIQLRYDIFVRQNMADVLLGVHARQNRIPLICIKSPRLLVKPLLPAEARSIYNHSLLQVEGSEFNCRSRVNEYLARHWR